MTLPIESMRTFFSPSASSRFLYSAARADSLNGGDGICVSSTCCWSVHALSALMMSSAARTFGFDVGSGDWATSGDAASARRGGVGAYAQRITSKSDEKLDSQLSRTGSDSSRPVATERLDPYATRVDPFLSQMRPDVLD